MKGMDAAAIFEREAEREAIAELAAAAARGEAGVLLLDGPAGIGKTALLREARAAASRNGLTTLLATASPLDREFPFGVVHQLLDPVMADADEQRRDRILGGAASRASALVLGDAAVSDVPTHALLHG